MKKILFTMAALAAAAMVSCVKDEKWEPTGPEQPATETEVKTLCINEVSPNTKKLEFFNTGKEEIDLKGCYLVKDGGDRWDFPAVKLGAGKVIVYTAKSTDPKEGPSFGMSATKGFKLELFNSKDAALDVLDNSKGSEKFFEFDESQADQTLGRKADGDGQWVIFNPGSIGESNSKGTFVQNWGEKVEPKPAGPEVVTLNEINGNDKFIEIFNGSKSDSDISGVKILKDGKDVWTAAENTILKAGEYYLLYSEDVVVEGGAQAGYDAAKVFNSGLSSKKAVQVTLTKGDGTTIDDFNLAEHPTGKAIKGSYGRNKDGKWYIQETATPGKENVDGATALTGLK